mgnify:CR=1 FL=1
MQSVKLKLDHLKNGMLTSCRFHFYKNISNLQPPKYLTMWWPRRRHRKIHEVEVGFSRNKEELESDYRGRLENMWRFSSIWRHRSDNPYRKQTKSICFSPQWQQRDPSNLTTPKPLEKNSSKPQKQKPNNETIQIFKVLATTGEMKKWT